MCSVEIEKNRMIKNIMKKVRFFSSSWVLEWIFFGLFLSKWLMLFVHIGNVQTSIKGKPLRTTHSQIFLKIAVLKNFAILSRKTCVAEYLLIKLQAWRSAFLSKKRFQHSCFSVNIAKFLRTIFFIKRLLFITFPKLYVMIELFGRLWMQNWHFSNFLYHSFVFLHNSIRINIPWLFRTYFHTKIVTFVKCNFRMHYKFRNNSRITVTSPSNLLWKLWIWVFWILCFVLIFL